MKLINIGFGNMVSANRLVAIVSPESAPIKRIIQDAKERGSLIDATYGRRTRAVIVTDSDHVILSAVQPETVANRLNDRDEDLEDEEELDEDEEVAIALLAVCADLYDKRGVISSVNLSENQLITGILESHRINFVAGEKYD